MAEREPDAARRRACDAQHACSIMQNELELSAKYRVQLYSSTRVLLFFLKKYSST